MERTQKIIRTSILGIAVNLVLVAFKLTVGLLANSIAVILDAVNNLSDALSSIITIIGTKLANKRPDKEHPFGHGRIEYLTGMLIAVIVLFAGFSSLRESIIKLIHPEPASYTILSLIIIAVGVAAKYFTGRYVKRVGTKLNSQALIASGSDALFDAILSFATLVGAVASLFWGWNLEGILGAVLSGFILKAGVEMLLETLSSLTGTRADKDLTDALKSKICSYDAVSGAYDLTLHEYGPTNLIGSVHIEVPDEMPAREIHRLSRHIAADIYQQFGVVLTVGIYAAGDSNPDTEALRQQVMEIVASYPGILQMHGFFADAEQKRLMFDLIIDFSADAPAIYAEVCQKVQALRPDWKVDIVLDRDYSE